MDAIPFDQLVRSLSPGSRRAAVTLAAGVTAALLGTVGREGAARKKKRKKCKKKRPPSNPCDGQNWCIDRSQTCGPEGGFGKCLVEAFGSNICAEILIRTDSCSDCDPPGCVDCVCILATGGGDRCNNGPMDKEFICARPV